MKIDALIIGAGRSGTTTIAEYLKLHSEVNFSTIKEVHFFSLDDLFNKGEKYLNNFFVSKPNKKVSISADTYLFIASDDVIKRIYDYNPEIKIIVMLRKPVERAFSGYLYAINNGYLDENTSFEQEIKNEKILIEKEDNLVEQNNLCNIYQSRYYFHLKRWMKIFPKENFIILKTSDLKNNTVTLLKILTDSLGISEFKQVNEIKANAAKSVKSKKLEQFLLNRDNPIRRFIRHIVPRGLKNFVIKSGVVDKVHSVNKSSENQQRTITEQEYNIAFDKIKNDIVNLKNEFGINFD